MKTLEGLNVVITRPEKQGRRWQQQLQKLGADTHLIPVMQIVPVVSDAEHRALQLIANRLHQYHCIIFVSQNAVNEARNYFKTLPLSAQLLAIGAATAATINEHWQLNVKAGDKAMNSETLLALPELHTENIQGKQILICRGVGGRTRLADTLQARGASVDYAELYHRRVQPQASQQLRDLFATPQFTGRKFLLTSHSGDSIEMLIAALSGMGSEAQVKSNPILVPGERVAAIAKTQGFSKIVCAANASDETMTATMMQWWSNSGS